MAFQKIDRPPTKENPFDVPRHGPKSDTTRNDTWERWLGQLYNWITQGVSVFSSSGTIGKVTLGAGTATVNTTKITANTLVFLTTQTASNAGSYTITRTVGSSFTITSSNGADASTLAYILIEPV
jgi:hypothetical protein